MAEEPTPEELLTRVAERDEEALGELYGRFAARLLGVVRRIVSDRTVAEEVLQETFLRLWNEAGRAAQKRGSLAAWLVIAARATAIDRLRSRRGLPPLACGKPDLLRKSFSWLPPPEKIALIDQRRELLKKVINQLPVAQRQALELAFFEGYTEAEIAQKLGEPLGRIKTALRAALRFLRHRLRAVLGTWAVDI